MTFFWNIKLNTLIFKRVVKYGIGIVNDFVRLAVPLSLLFAFPDGSVNRL